MKRIIAGLLMLGFAFPAMAQLKGFSLGPFVEAGWPAGSFQQTHKSGYGAGFGADVRLGKIGFTGSVGFMHFGVKSGTVAEQEQSNLFSINAIPMRAGIKYRLAPALYLKFESGVAKFTNKDPSAVIVSPGIGVRILGLDIQAKYELWNRQSQISFWGLKAGFNF